MNPRGQPSPRVLVRNIAANWFGLVAEVAVAFALTPFILARLGVVAYGVWGVLTSLIGYLGLVDLGVRGGLGRFLNFHLALREFDAARQVVATTLAFLTAMASVALLASFALGLGFERLFPRTPQGLADDAVLLLPMMALGLWLSFVSAVLRTVVTAFDRFDLLNIVGLGMLVLRTVGTVVALRQGYALTGLVVVNVVANALGTLATYWLARRLWPELRLRRLDIRWQRFREVWRFGLVSFTSRTAATLAVQAGPIIAMSALGAPAVASYTVATALIQNCQRIVEQMGATLYPTIMKLGGTGDMEAMRRLFVLYSRLVIVVGGLLYFGLIAFAEPFIRLWLGPEVIEAAPVAAILAAAELSAVFTSTASLTLYSLGRLRAHLSIALVHAALIVALSVILTAGFDLGLRGLALGVLMPSVACLGIAYPLVAARAIGLEAGRYFLGSALRLAAIAVVALIGFSMIASALGTDDWVHLLTTLAAASVYFIAVGSPVALGFEGLKWLRSVLPRRRGS